MFNIYLQEKAIALKIGRQKKIQIIDGQQVEVLTGDDEDDEVKKCTLHNFSFLEKSIRFLSHFLLLKFF
jgi:putative sterol carrier protein